MQAIQRFFRNLASRLRIAGGLVAFFWRRKVWWMVPLVVAILLVGIVVIVGQSSAVSAFIYSLF